MLPSYYWSRSQFESVQIGLLDMKNELRVVQFLYRKEKVSAKRIRINKRSVQKYWLSLDIQLRRIETFYRVNDVWAFSSKNELWIAISTYKDVWDHHDLLGMGSQ